MLWRHDPTSGDRKQLSRVGESGQALLQSVPRPPFWHRQTRHPTTQLRQAASVIASGLLARAGGAPARSTPIEDLPRPAVAAAEERTGGIKQATIGTTV